MRLSHLYIDHFRNLKDVVHPVDGVRVFIGPNGAGKTSLLEAVRRLSDSYTPGSRSVESFGGYRIYEVDDCLTGDLLVDDEWGESEQRLLRSDAAFNLAAALLGTSAMRSVLREGGDSDDDPGRNALVLDAEGLNQRLQEGAAIFRCDSETTLLELLRTNSHPSLDGLRARYTQLGEQLRNDEHLRDATAEISARCLFEFETDESLGPIEDRDDDVGLHYRVASQILDLAKDSQRFAWAESGIRESHWPSEHSGAGQRRTQTLDRAWTYHGVIIDRDDVGDELAHDLDVLSGLVREMGGGQWSWRGMWNLTHDSVTALEGDWPYPAPASPHSMGQMPPALDDVLDQWLSSERFLRVSFLPGWHRSLWHKGHVTLLGTADQPREIQRPEFGELLSGPFDSSESGGNPIGLPAFDTAVAEGDAETLHAEVEAGLADLGEHIWRDIERYANSALGGLDQSDLPEVLGSPGREGLNFSFGGGWIVPADNPFEFPKPWIRESHEDRIQDPGLTYVVKPSIPPVLALLAYTANQVAPRFLQFAGLIAIDLKALSAWSPQSRLHISFGGRTLDQLPSGWSRWVAISVRMAYRRLAQSEIWLSPTDEEHESSGHSDDLSALLRAARVMSDPQSAGRAFSVVPTPSDKTTLLIDEPEAHLHPDAALDVKTWLTDTLAETGTSAIVATHSSVFMDYTPEEATITGLEPPGTRADADADSEFSTLYDAGRDFVEWVRDHGEGLGISTLGGLSFYRGFLLVEGPHDEAVVRHFFKEELDKNRIGIVVLWGLPSDDKGEARRLAESKFLRYTHKPCALLVDNAVLQSVQDPSIPLKKLSYEERQLRWFTEAFIESGVRLKPASHGLRDIALALPERSVREFLASKGITGTFEGGWDEVENVLSATPGLESGSDMKRKVSSLLGLQNFRHGYSLGNFIQPVLALSEKDRPTQPLESSMQEIMAWFADGAPPTGA